MTTIAARAVVEAVINFPQQLWRVVSISKKYYRVFGYSAVLAPLVKTTKRTTNTYSVQAVQQRIRRVRTLWRARLEELVGRGLWYPCPYDNLTTLQFTLRRLVNCRPTCCWLADNRRIGSGLDTKIKPCGRPYFCPFCAARLATALARRVVNGCGVYAQHAPDNYELAYRELALRVPVIGLAEHTINTPEMRRNRALLAARVAEIKKLLRHSARRVSAQTLGSLTTIVIDPQPDAFIVYIRQLFLTSRGNKNPWLRFRGAKTTVIKRAAVDDRAAILSVLSAFVRYPGGMLSCYPETAAVVLSVRHEQRFRFATGVFKQKKRTASCAKKEFEPGAATAPRADAESTSGAHQIPM